LSDKSGAADLAVSNNAVIVLFGDSFDQDQYGTRYGSYLQSYFALNYPQYNIYWRGASRSGGTLKDVLTNRVEQIGLGHWGYGFNSYQHIGIVQTTDNGGDSSNSLTATVSQIFQAPKLMSSGGSNLVNEGGWASANTVQWIGVGDTPEPGDTNGYTANRDRNNAMTNAGWQLGVRGVDLWNSLSRAWTNDYNTRGTNALVGWFPGGHPGNPGHLCMALVILRQLTTDTNISSCAVDWNGSLVSADHCAVSGISQAGNRLTFQRKDDRLPLGWDSLDGTGSVTNDCRNAFVLMPELADTFKFMLTVTNLPPGLYSVVIDGTPVATLSDTVLARGWNMFTNTVGPYWAQRKEVLGRTRDQKYVNRVTLTAGSAGDQQGLVSYGSYASLYWTNKLNRGDQLISLLSTREANVIGYDAKIRDAAQPTNHTFTILPFAPTANINVSSAVNALNVPVILDGSSSIKATNYYWEQISGLPQLDMIGQGTAKPMLISVTNAGNYTFQLTVSDGQTSDTSQVMVTFVQPVGRTIFVDNQLTANCLNNNYSIAGRNSAGADANAYTTIQGAATASLPGDLIYIRGGVYSNAPSNPNQVLVTATKSGTATAPIRYEAYNNEYVQLAGWGFSDADTNADGMADGPTYPLWRQTLFLIPPGSDYIQVKGLEFTNSQQGGLAAEGRFDYVYECTAHDNWTSAFAIARMRASATTQTGTVFRWLEACRSRHFTGIAMALEDQATFGFMSDCAIVDCISYRNGYQPNGKEVMPIGGDPQGGGNSDGIGATKLFSDNASFTPVYGVRNWGTNLYFVRSIAWNNCDDGFDTSCGSSTLEDNRSLFNGPTGTMGYKMFRYSQNMIFRGNIAYGNMGRGFELRIDTNAFLQVLNNTSVKNTQHGFYIAGTDATSTPLGTNNVAAYNGGPDWPLAAQSPNWSSDGSVLPPYNGDPRALNTNVVLTTAFQPAWTVRQKHDYMESQIKKTLSPAIGSPLLSAGVFLAGYHCARPDNDPVSPMPASAPGRHWKLPAPDLGALNWLNTNSSTLKPPAPTGLRVVQ
jgi:hypothetical protein